MPGLKTPRRSDWLPDCSGDQVMYVLPLFMLFAIVCGVLVSCTA